jgi:nitrogen fixation protein FixH
MSGVTAMHQIRQVIRQRWIPSIFVLGFLVVVAVNAVLIVTATGSFSGLVVAHPYKKGAEYTRVHQALVEQKALDWHYTLETVPRGDAGQLRIVMQWQDGAALALSDLVVNVEASRPVENVAPMVAELQRRGGGRYETVLELSREGLWDLRITASQGVVGQGGRQFVAAERIQVK